MFVADDGNTLVGMALSLPGRADDGAGAQIQGLRHLTGLSVLPDRWGRGIGGQLLDTVLTEASQQGSVRVTLWTHATNLMRIDSSKPAGSAVPDGSGRMNSGPSWSIVNSPCPVTPKPDQTQVGYSADRTRTMHTPRSASCITRPGR